MTGIAKQYTGVRSSADGDFFMSPVSAGTMCGRTGMHHVALDTFCSTLQVWCGSGPIPRPSCPDSPFPGAHHWYRQDVAADAIRCPCRTRR